MKISDNIIKHHLSHVYWVYGTSCAGKSSTTKYLSKKYDMVLYDSDNKGQDYKKISDIKSQPALNQHFEDWEEYFNRPPEVYAKWLEDSLTEQFDIMIVDLLTYPKNKKIIVDTHCFVDDPVKITAHSRMIHLTSSEELAIKQYLQREDKRDMYECIMRLKEPEKSLKNLNDTISLLHVRAYNKIISSGMKYIIRNEETKVYEMSQEMAEHFGLV
ncbi:MAG: hypothetical protein KAQ68_07555 [Clostridiales bacterium]|nr:hypothetical protein [Clostridiales bacterium]